jgi:hypothetical protein
MLECDRCGKDYAARIQILLTKNSPHREQFDLCIDCILDMATKALSFIPENKRKDWLRQFIEGIIS